MSDPRNELTGLAHDLRALVTWEAKQGPIGWDPAPPRPAPARPQAAPASRASTRPAAPPTAISAPTGAAGPLPTSMPRPDLSALREELGDCRRCKLCEQGRTNIVFGVGNPNADLLFAGEGPGFHEDQQGIPFVGNAGDLLTKMIGAMGLSRDAVYICNVVKCRPPNNRDPEPDEIAACRPFLEAQVRAVQPKVIVTLGRFASQTLLGSTESMGRMRGRFHSAMGAKVMPTYHPAFLLRSPEFKGKTWADLQQVMAELGLKRGGR